MTDTFMFEDTRPYTDEEVPAAIHRIATNPSFDFIVKYLFPNADLANFKKEFLTIQSTREFQIKVMDNAIWSIVNKTSTGLTQNGLEKLYDNRNRMFISNHRDILLDAAILQILLVQHQIDTSEITFGSNLMRGDLVIDIGKINKMFKIERGGNIRTFYKSSLEVSRYMRYAINEKHQSVWIAQRNGRTKDGDDKTEIGVLKMFSLSSDKPFIDNLEELNITPIAISYEYEPCDFQKATELFISKYQKYEKSPNEDLESILHGITQFKGGISLSICDEISHDELVECNRMDKNEKFNQLSKLIDERIYNNYKLFKTNYIAYDLLHNTEIYADHYTVDEKKDFIQYMEDGLRTINLPFDELKSIFLSIYANSVINIEHLNK
ncbi:MAG: acyltransferase [Bacteroidales bacterium]|nr:acyltransferase [Bacteroidales bacterium]